jgi:hypothetical protein
VESRPRQPRSEFAYSSLPGARALTVPAGLRVLRLSNQQRPRLHLFAGLSLDVRQALWLLHRQPGVACLSVLMIALGIGVTSTLFSLVNGVLLKPLPWRAADRLVRVYENRTG